MPPGDRRVRRDLVETLRESLGGRYAIGPEIGRGGAARVFRATDETGRQVALKVLHPQLAVSVTADRFLREISLLDDMEHPLIAKLLDYGESDYLVYYVMKYVEGPTLKQSLERAGRLSVSDTLRTARDLLDALGYAHGRGVVHRDVKPENIVVSPEGAVLMDFGIARAIAASGSERLTRSGFTVGTSSYMSPEQVSGDADIDYRGDLYSVGCVLYECLAGQPPFVHRQETVVLQMHVDQAPPDLDRVRTDVPATLRDAIGKALKKDRSDRWQTAGEMAGAIAAPGKGEPV